MSTASEKEIRIVVDNGNRSQWWTRLVFFGLVMSIMFNIVLYSAYGTYLGEVSGPMERYHSGDKTSEQKIALLNIDFTIMPPYTERTLKTIKKISQDDSIQGVVVVVDSPGGLVADSHQIYDKLLELSEKKPMNVAFKRLAASGGYYIAMGAGPEAKIFAEPTTWTGSIGVIIPHYDMTDLADKIGLDSNPITTGEFKDSLSPFKPLSEREQEVWKGIIDDAYTRFISVIDGSRSELTKEQITELATGRIFTTNQSLENGLIDAEGYLEDAVADLEKRIGIEGTRVIDYQSPPNLMDYLMGNAQSNLESNLLRQILNSGVPQAFYFMGWN